MSHAKAPCKGRRVPREVLIEKLQILARAVNIEEAGAYPEFAEARDWVETHFGLGQEAGVGPASRDEELRAP